MFWILFYLEGSSKVSSVLLEKKNNNKTTQNEIKLDIVLPGLQNQTPLLFRVDENYECVCVCV